MKGSEILAVAALPWGKGTGMTPVTGEHRDALCWLLWHKSCPRAGISKGPWHGSSVPTWSPQCCCQPSSANRLQIQHLEHRDGPVFPALPVMLWEMPSLPARLVACLSLTLPSLPASLPNSCLGPQRGGPSPGQQTEWGQWVAAVRAESPGMCQ